MNSFWKDKRVLITGGTGFLGKHLSDALLKEGASLSILDFRKPGWEIREGNFYEADIRDKDKLNTLCRNIDIVFHLAAMPSIARGKFNEYFEINVKGTENILEAAFQNKVKKFVHISSSTVYGVPNEFPLKEDSRLSPIGKYGKSKLEAERLCRRFIAKGMDISIIRPRVIMGPGRIGIFSILFERICHNKPVYLIGKGKNVFQFTNIFDMVSACMKAAEYTSPDLFNIGSNDLLPVKDELLALIRYAKSNSCIKSLNPMLTKISLKGLSCLGVSPLVNEQFCIADKNFKLDTTYAKAKLNWQPLYSNLDSLIQAYDWYIKNVGVNAGQYQDILGVLGKFKHSKMGAFQE